MGGITDIYAIGDDAFANMYDIQFSDSWDGSLVSTLSLKYLINDDFTNLLRCTEVAVPEFTIGTYEVHWKTLKLVKPNGKTEFAGTFTSTFRLDKNYNLYYDIYTWNRAVLNPVTGIVAKDDSTENYRANASIYVYDPKDANTKVGYWDIQGLYPSNCPEISLTADSGDPITLNVTWNCISAEFIR